MLILLLKFPMISSLLSNFCNYVDIPINIPIVDITIWLFNIVMENHHF